MTSKHVTNAAEGLLPLQQTIRASIGSSKCSKQMQRPESYTKDPTNLPGALVTCARNFCRLSARAFMPLQA